MALRELVPHLFILYLREMGHREKGTRKSALERSALHVLVFIIVNTRWRSDSVLRLQVGGALPGRCAASAGGCQRGSTLLF